MADIQPNRPEWLHQQRLHPGHISTPNGGACEHGPRSVAAGFTRETGAFLRQPRLIYNNLAQLSESVHKYGQSACKESTKM